MSVLFRSNTGVNYNIINGEGNSGYPPQQVKDAKIVQRTRDSISISYSDPDDTIYEGITFSKWEGTMLIRNETRVPEPIEDGVMVFNNTTRNAYKDTEFQDRSVVFGKTYYYRFFTYSDQGVYNNEFQYYKVIFTSIPDFQDATWDVIHDVIQAGNAQDFFNIGDTKIITINPCLDMTGGEVEFMIAGFDVPRVSKTNHYGSLKELPDGEHNICLVTKWYSEHMKTNQLWTEGINTSNSVFFYYRDSGNKKIAENLTCDIPSQYMLDTVEGTSQSGIGMVSNKFNFITAWELGFTENGVDQGNKAIPIFTDNESRKFGQEYWTLCAKYSSSNNGYPSGARSGGYYTLYPKTCKTNGSLGNSKNDYSSRRTDYVRVKCFIG